MRTDEQIKQAVLEDEKRQQTQPLAETTVEALASMNGKPQAGAWSLPFGTIGAALINSEEEPDWLVPGFLAPSALTLLAGRPKVGKSTLIFALMRALRDGTPILGTIARPARVLLLTEERQLTLAEKTNLFKLEDDDFHVLMRHQLQGFSWPEAVAQAVAYCEATKLAVLVVDSWDKWADLRGDGENSTGDTIRNIQPLLDAAGDGLAVLISTHQRKEEGKHGEAVRGSTALPGAVDVILELERTSEGGGRVLLGTSRLEATPEKLVLNWDKANGTFSADDYDQAKASAEAENVFAAVTTDRQNLQQIRERVGGRKDLVRAHLAALVDARRIEQSGTGKRKDPLLWWRPDSAAQVSGPDLRGVGAGPETESGANPHPEATYSGPEAGSGNSEREQNLKLNCSYCGTLFEPEVDGAVQVRCGTCTARSGEAAAALPDVPETTGGGG